MWSPTDLANQDLPAKWSHTSQDDDGNHVITPPPQGTIIQQSSPIGENHPACSPDPIPPEEMNLISNMADTPPRIGWWNTRDEDRLYGPHSAPIRLADRRGRVKLRSGRERAAPYTNGVFRHRMGIDYRVPQRELGIHKVIQICESPTSPRSPTSLH